MRKGRRRRSHKRRFECRIRLARPPIDGEPTAIRRGRADCAVCCEFPRNRFGSLCSWEFGRELPPDAILQARTDTLSPVWQDTLFLRVESVSQSRPEFGYSLDTGRTHHRSVVTRHAERHSIRLFLAIS